MTPERPDGPAPPPTRAVQPLILVRGFGGIDVGDEKKIAYQGFNTGTVYPQKRGENYIYEGMVLRLLKSGWGYGDATNVIGYYGSPQRSADDPRAYPELEGIDPSLFRDARVVIDTAMARNLIRTVEDPRRTLWIFRYYDLDDRTFEVYGEALARLITIIRALVRLKTGAETRVNIVAHSMGGLIVRQVIQSTYPSQGADAASRINKVVTLGTPHRGISFQVIKNWIPAVDAEEELEHFNPEFQEDGRRSGSYKRLGRHFPLDRFLTVVGTEYRTYGVGAATKLNRLFSMRGEFGPSYNRSDGLVKQTSAQIPGAPRTFVHKCHGGYDSLVTSREAFEIATRFFMGDLRIRLRLLDAEIQKGRDLIGRSEFFFGVSVKPRGVDFELFHQSKEGENCYGPFRETDLGDDDPSFGWAGADRLIWEGWLDTGKIHRTDRSGPRDLVFRLEVYVSERDLFGIGFSDNVISHTHVWIRASLGDRLRLYCHADERFARPDFEPPPGDAMTRRADGAWNFSVDRSGFRGRFGIEIEHVPEVGEPTKLVLDELDPETPGVDGPEPE